MQFYKQVNPDFRVHDIHRDNVNINDLERIYWTRMRVNGHSLAVESGRWNRRGRGRLPLEERLCSCGVIQTEKHVIEECPKTQYIRNRFNFTRSDDLFGDVLDYAIACKIVHMILLEYQ